jgi:hypothetical protein
MSQIAQCRLCGKRANLLKKSHIIPNFMFKKIRDDNGRMILVNFNDPNGKSFIEQTGYYEKSILCTECDNERLSKLEKYADLLLFGGSGKTVPDFIQAIGPDGVKSFIISNVDYRKLKMFLLSILWRSHISKNKFFQHINLGEEAEKIRKVLLSELDLKEDEFKIALVAVRSSKGLIRFVSSPYTIQVGEGKVAIFFINGFFYFIDLIPSSDFVLFKKHYLTESGKYEVMLLDEEKAADFLRAYGLPTHVVDYYLSE